MEDWEVRVAVDAGETGWVMQTPGKGDCTGGRLTGVDESLELVISTIPASFRSWGKCFLLSRVTR